MTTPTDPPGRQVPIIHGGPVDATFKWTPDDSSDVASLADQALAAGLRQIAHTLSWAIPAAPAERGASLLNEAARRLEAPAELVLDWLLRFYEGGGELDGRDQDAISHVRSLIMGWLDAADPSCGAAPASAGGPAMSFPAPPPGLTAAADFGQAVPPDIAGEVARLCRVPLPAEDTGAGQ